MLCTYHVLDIFTYCFSFMTFITISIPMLQMNKLRVRLSIEQLSFLPNIGSKGQVLSTNPHCT